MKDQRPGRRVLHFAVTGALLGGGSLVGGCASADGEPEGNAAKQQEPKTPPDGEDAGPVRANPGPDEREPKHVNVAPEDDTPPAPSPVEEDHVNPGPVDALSPEGRTSVGEVVGTTPPETDKQEPQKEEEPPHVNPGPTKAPSPKPKKYVNTGKVRDPKPE